MHKHRQHHRRSFRPRFEALEPRLNMSVVLGFDGQQRLTSISEDALGQADAVSLVAQADGRVSVHEGAAALGTFVPARNLSISLGAVKPGLVNLLQLDNHTVKTNLDVNLQSPGGTPAPTQFRVLGGKVDVAGEGTIDGNVRVRGGAGNQFFVFGEFGKAVAHVVNVTGWLSADMGPGGESFPNGAPDAVASVGRPPAAGASGDIARVNVRGNVDVRNANVFTIAGSVGGNLMMDSRAKSSFQQVVLGNFGRPFTLNGNAVIRTGGGNDSIAVENATLRKNLSIDSGAGNDTIELANSDPNNGAPYVDVPATVRGNVYLDLGDGDDVVEFGAASQVVAGATVRFHVGGSLTVDGGAGNEMLKFIDARLDGHSIDLRTGQGNDKIEVSHLEAARAHVMAKLGDGDDTLTFVDGASLLVRRFTADGGRGGDDVEFGDLAAMPSWLKLLNFES
jgi:hypothetical protein